VGAALALELVAVGGGVPRFARPAIALAALGMARATGALGLRSALLALFLVPVPTRVLELANPALVPLQLGVADAALRVLGCELPVLGGGLAATATHSLVLDEGGGGLPLVALLGGLGWYAAARACEPPRAAIRRAVALAPLGLPLQAAGVTAALATLALGAPQVGRALLDHLWLAAAACAVAGVELRRRGAP
jgi:hypothetical protein